eukprot:9991647-Alexandrium_andersonii.AAC.1
MSSSSRTTSGSSRCAEAPSPTWPGPARRPSSRSLLSLGFGCRGRLLRGRAAPGTQPGRRTFAWKAWPRPGPMANPSGRRRLSR